jgi:hypothetical protein
VTTDTTTNPHPDIPLPPGAVFGDVWEGEGDGLHHVIMGRRRGITDTDVVLGDVWEGDSPEGVIVWTTAVQFADGTIDTRPLDAGRSEPPMAHMDAYPEDGLTAAQARELAAVLLEVADKMDGWTR